MNGFVADLKDDSLRVVPAQLRLGGSGLAGRQERENQQAERESMKEKVFSRNRVPVLIMQREGRQQLLEQKYPPQVRES